MPNLIFNKGISRYNMHDKALLGSSIVFKSTKSSSDQDVLEALLLL